MSEDSPPGRHVLQTSAALDWQNCSLERRRHDAGDWSTPALPVHMVCLYVGPPMQIEQHRDQCRRIDRIVDGDLQIVPAGSDSGWKHGVSSQFISLVFPTALVEQVRDEQSGAGGKLVDRFCVRDPQLEMLARELDREMASRAPNGALYADSLATAVAALLLRRHASHRRDVGSPAPVLRPSTLRKVLGYIDVHLATRLTLPELAALAGLGVSHFSATFRRATGHAPHEYVIRRRVDLAQRLLTTTDLPIADVAIAAGFYDQSHLARHMRRILKTSPREMRLQQ